MQVSRLLRATLAQLSELSDTAAPPLEREDSIPRRAPAAASKPAAAPRPATPARSGPANTRAGSGNPEAEPVHIAGPGQPSSGNSRRKRSKPPTERRLRSHPAALAKRHFEPSHRPPSQGRRPSRGIQRNRWTPIPGRRHRWPAGRRALADRQRVDVCQEPSAAPSARSPPVAPARVCHMISAPIRRGYPAPGTEDRRPRLVDHDWPRGYDLGPHRGSGSGQLVAAAECDADEPVATIRRVRDGVKQRG
jgi:hypothetical protein